MEATLAALAEPSRLRIVELLRGRELSVGEVAEALGIRQPQASKHLRVLRHAGLVGVESRSRLRVHHLRAEPFDELGAWAQAITREWEDRLDRLGDFLDETHHQPEEGAR